MEELQVIQNKIYEIRGTKVMLDFDLAEIYQVETRVLNQAVKRNIARFPEDFMFQLTNTELDIMSSQNVMTLKAKRPKSALPFAFTEQIGRAVQQECRSSDLTVRFYGTWRHHARKRIKKRDCHTNQHSNHPRFCRHPETCIYPADRQNNRNPARNKRTERIHRRSLYRLQRHQRRHAYATGTHQPSDCRTAK